MKKDSQKSRVYRWENDLPQGPWLAWDEIEAYVAIVWAAEDLQWPPLVEKMHKNNSNAGEATRHMVSFPEDGASESTILHELAHAMTATCHDADNGHGKQFVGIYMRLLCEHLDVPLPMSLYFAKQHRIEFDLHAKIWAGK